MIIVGGAANNLGAALDASLFVILARVIDVFKFDLQPDPPQPHLGVNVQAGRHSPGAAHSHPTSGSATGPRSEEASFEAAGFEKVSGEEDARFDGRPA